MNIADLPRPCLALILDLCDEATKLALRSTCRANQIAVDSTVLGLQCCIWARDPSDELRTLNTSLGSGITSLLLPRGVVSSLSPRQQQGLCFPRLQHLVLNYRLAAPCRALAAAAGTSLTSLTITQGGTSKGTRWLQKHCRLLRELQRLPSLRRLHCALALQPASAEVVGRLSQLQSLALTGAQPSGPGSRVPAATLEPPFGPELWRLAIEPLTGLTRLDLALPLMVPRDPSALLGPLSQLRCLQLQLLQDRGASLGSVPAHRDCASGAAGAARLLASFPPLQHLTRLQVIAAAPYAAYWVSGVSNELEPDAFPRLGQLPQLRSLELGLAHWQVSLRDLQPLSACRQLTELVLPELVLSLAEDPERAELGGPDLTEQEQAAVTAAMAAAAAAAAAAPAAEACRSSSCGGGGSRWRSSGAGVPQAEVTVFGEPHTVPLLPGLRRLACRTLYWRLPLALLAPALEDVTYKRLRNVGHGGSYVLPDLWPEPNLLDALGGGNPGEGAGAFVVNLLNQLMDNNNNDQQFLQGNNPWLEGGGLHWFQNLQPGDGVPLPGDANWQQQGGAVAGGDDGLLAELEQLAVQLAGMADGLADVPVVGAADGAAAAEQPAQDGHDAGPSHAAAGNAAQQHQVDEQEQEEQQDRDGGSEGSSDHESFWQLMEQVAEHGEAGGAAPHAGPHNDYDDFGYDYNPPPQQVAAADDDGAAGGPEAAAADNDDDWEAAAAVGDGQHGAGPLALVPWAQQVYAAAVPAAADGPPPAPIALQEAPLNKVVGDVLRGQACLQVLDVDVTALCKVARLSSLPLANLRALRLHMLGEVKLPPGGLPPLPCLTYLEFYLPDERNWETDYNDDEDLALWQHQANVLQVTVRGTFHAGGFFAPQHLARAAACMPRLQVFRFVNCWDLRPPSLQRVLQSGVAPRCEVVMPAKPPPLVANPAAAAASSAAAQAPWAAASSGPWDSSRRHHWAQGVDAAMPPAGLSGEADADAGCGQHAGSSGGSGATVGDEQGDAASSSMASSSSGSGGCADPGHAWLAGQQECSPEPGPSGCDSDDDDAAGSSDELSFAPYRPGQTVNRAVVQHMAAAAAGAGVKLVWIDSPVSWRHWLADSD